MPTHFKEGGVEWQQSSPAPLAALSGDWWLAYKDKKLTELVSKALQANQSIAGSEAAYRLAQATVAADSASLFPTVSLGASGTRARTITPTALSSTTSILHNTASGSGTVGWEPDLWGEVRRQIDSGKDAQQSSAATLAGERLSIVSTLASDYFELRQLDIDIDLLKQQQNVDYHLLAISRAGFAQGTLSADSVLQAQDTLEAAIANLQISETSREQSEHAIAVLTGVPPADLSIAYRADYVFATPVIPVTLPSTLLQRRPDVVSAERSAASANARMGVAKAAFFPYVDFSAQGGFQHNALANLFTVPSRVWTLGPDVAATIFDGGARRAAVLEARATYDQAVATYRQALLGAFQNVEDSLSSITHQRQQVLAFADVYQRNLTLFTSKEAQFRAGTASTEDTLTQKLTLLSARQSLVDGRHAGIPPWRKNRLQQTWDADGQRLRRVLQRIATRRMLERSVVRLA